MSIKFLLLLITTIITGCNTDSNTNNSITDSSEITTPVAEVITNTFPSEIIIVGEVKVGSQLSTVIKDDDGFDNNDVIYQWYADDVEIDNATFSTLLLTDAQLRLTITVIATFNDDLGFKEIAVSAATDAVWRINVKGKVIVNGTPEINNKLVADVFDEDGISSEIAYKWYANDLEIADETHSLLMLTDAIFDRASNPVESFSEAYTLYSPSGIIDIVSVVLIKDVGTPSMKTLLPLLVVSIVVVVVFS